MWIKQIKSEMMWNKKSITNSFFQSLTDEKTKVQGSEVKAKEKDIWRRRQESNLYRELRKL